MAAYYVASGNGVVAADNLAAMAYVTPVDGQVPAAWQTVQVWTATQPYPHAGAPANIASLPNAVAAGASTDGSTADAILNFPLASTQNPNVMQVRIYTNHAGSAGNSTYYRVDIAIDTAAGTWTQIFPAPATGPAATNTTLGVQPNPSTVGTTVTLTATESPAAAGSVQFKNGTTNIGAPVAVNGSGVAVTTTNTLPQGSNSLSAVFTPTDTTAFSGSTGNATATVNPTTGATPTTTALAIGGSNTQAGQPVTLTASVTPTAAAGAVAFQDNGAALPGTVTNPSAGTYMLSLPSGFAAGSHSVVAQFTPTDSTAFGASASPPQAFVTQTAGGGGPACSQPGSNCTDVQNIQGTIPVGTLVINTPYTATSPLDLGTLALSADSTKYSSSKSFNNIVVTDTRSGNLSWTVSALASPLTDGGSNPNSTINAQNVGLTGVTSTPGTGFIGPVTTSDNTAANAVGPTDPGSAGLGGSTAHTVATATKGQGTDTLQGTLTLNAPSSTEAGLFKGTITFTVG
jgi:hypothetical protein